MYHSKLTRNHDHYLNVKCGKQLDSGHFCYIWDLLFQNLFLIMINILVLILHVAVTILSNSMHINCYSDYPKSLLEYFVNTFIILYGKENASSNIHNLLHLHDDAIKFGTLKEFSAFPFENYLQSILKMIRKNDKILKQTVCQISEKNSYVNSNQELKIKTKIKTKVNCALNNLHFNSPFVNLNLHSNFHTCNQFNKVTFKNYTLKTQ